MKKHFLIPLLTLVCSVMAWGENVAIAQIGETTYYKGDEADAGSALNRYRHQPRHGLQSGERSLYPVDRPVGIAESGIEF